jgi:hypothetical protein
MAEFKKRKEGPRHPAALLEKSCHGAAGKANRDGMVESARRDGFSG